MYSRRLSVFALLFLPLSWEQSGEATRSEQEPPTQENTTNDPEMRHCTKYILFCTYLCLTPPQSRCIDHQSSNVMIHYNCNLYEYLNISKTVFFRIWQCRFVKSVINIEFLYTNITKTVLLLMLFMCVQGWVFFHKNCYILFCNN